MLRDGADDVDLWAMAAELERQFAGYKQRLAGRIRAGGDVDAPDDDVVVGASYAAGDAGDGDDGGGSSGHGEGAGDAACGGGDVRGRMYEAYTRRRDERLRSGWRARMERKEAEVMALWAQLGRASGSVGETTTTGGGGGRKTTAGEVQQEAEDDGEIKRRSSDVVAPPPRRISGKKYARTRSFSSTTLLKSSRPDVGRRRALSQDPPSPSRKVDAHRGRAVVGVGSGTAASKRKALMSGSKGSAKGHGSLKHAAGDPKPPRSLPRRCSSGGLLEGLGEAPPVQMSCSSDRSAADRDEAQAASPSRPLVGSGSGGTTGTASARDASLDSDHGEVVDSVAAADGCEAGAKNVDVEIKRDDEEIKRDDEEITASPGKLGNGEITSDSETEPTYVYIKKKVVVEEESSETLAGSDAKSHLEGKNGTGNADEPTTATTADGANIAEECATTNAEEAPARESSDESSFSGRSGRCSPPNSAPSCSSRAQPIERLLEADAALLRKKRDESAMAVSTPGSAGSRVSGTPQTSSSPRDSTPRGFKKRFLSFGKKNKGREPATVIDCTSPSVVYDNGGSGRWQTADSIKPRVGSSDAASDDTEHGYAASPQACSLQSLVAASPAKSELGEIVPREKSPKAHRSFFSLRSFNCGRS